MQVRHLERNVACLNIKQYWHIFHTPARGHLALVSLCCRMHQCHGLGLVSFWDLHPCSCFTQSVETAAGQILGLTTSQTQFESSEKLVLTVSVELSFKRFGTPGDGEWMPHAHAECAFQYKSKARAPSPPLSSAGAFVFATAAAILGGICIGAHGPLD